MYLMPCGTQIYLYVSIYSDVSHDTTSVRFSIRGVKAKCIMFVRQRSVY